MGTRGCASCSGHQAGSAGSSALSCHSPGDENGHRGPGPAHGRPARGLTSGRAHAQHGLTVPLVWPPGRGWTRTKCSSGRETALLQSHLTPEQLRGLPSVQRPQQDPAPLQGKDTPRTGDRAAACPPRSEPAGGTSCSLTPDLSLHPSSITTGVEVPGRLSKRTFLTPTAVTQVSTLNRGNY